MAVHRKIPTGETKDHLLTIGQELDRLEAELLEEDPESEVLPLVQRVLEEQSIREMEGVLQLRPGKEMSTDSLQSPHDLEATYRIKGGQEFRGGYVVNVSRLHDYLREKNGKKAPKGTISLSFSKMDLFRGFKHAFCHFLKTLSAFRLQPVSVSFR